MNNCPFCTDKVKKSLFLESNYFSVIYNISPILPGHSLIIPKRHISSFVELNDDEISELAYITKKTAAILQKTFNCNGFNWTIQDNEVAGQTVMHLHIHVIPRKANDLSSPGEWYKKLDNNNIIDSDKRTKLSDKEIENYVNLIKANI